MLRNFVNSVVLGSIVAVAMSSVANAAIVGSATLQANPPGVAFTAPDAALAAPWKSYALDISGNAGEIIAAVDVSISGPMHQRWTFNEDAGEFVSTPNSANVTNGDSHLRAIAGALFGAAATENNPGTGSPLPDTATARYGIGNSLTGAWGIPGPSQSSNASIAYLVLQDSQIPDFNISVKVADGLGNIIADLGCSAFFGAACSTQTGVAPVVVDYTNTDATLNKVVATTIGTSAGDTPITWGNLSNFSYTPGFGALPSAPGLSKQPTWDPNTQAFSWDTSGSTRGTYVWNVLATNATGNDTGVITVEVQSVPEPATLAMVCLAAFGCVSIARRRS